MCRQAHSISFCVRGGLDGGLGFFLRGGNARIVICRFIYHMRALKGEGGKLRIGEVGECS